MTEKRRNEIVTRQADASMGYATVTGQVYAKDVGELLAEVTDLRLRLEHIAKVAIKESGSETMDAGSGKES